jgi:hypothetical protein
MFVGTITTVFLVSWVTDNVSVVKEKKCNLSSLEGRLSAISLLWKGETDGKNTQMGTSLGLGLGFKFQASGVEILPPSLI